jgi:hypothetical protein
MSTIQNHGEYDAEKPLIYWPSYPMIEQIEAYVNQQEWLPEVTTNRRPRLSKDDLRRDKCKARYKAQFAKGRLAPENLMKAFKIQRQSVMLKMKEYVELGYIRKVENKCYEWDEKA